MRFALISAPGAFAPGRAGATGRALLAMSACLPASVLPAVAQEEPIRLPPVEVRAAYPLVPPQYARTPTPAYPAAARERGVEGVVLLAVHVLASGRVGEVRVKSSSGSPVLDEAGLKAVARWTFVPARRGPRAVDAWVEVPVKFALTSR